MKRRKQAVKTSRPSTPDPQHLSLPKFTWPDWSINQIRLLVAILATVCFANSLTGEFVFDDAETIVGNQDVQGGNPWRQVFHHDYWGADITANHSHKSYRPLTTLSFRLNAVVHNNVVGYHLVNIVLHIVVCELVLEMYSMVLQRILNVPDTRILLLATTYFTVHAVHTEVVSNITGRAELLSAIFYLLSFLLHNEWMKHDHDGCSASSTKALYTAVLSVLCAGVGVLCKEQAITVLAVNVVYDSIITLRSIDWSKMHRSTNRRRADEMNNNETEERCDQMPLVRAYLLRCVTVILCTVVLCTVRLYIMQFTTPTFTVYDNPASFMSSVFYRTINYNYIYCLNAWLLLNPSELCFDYSMGCIPLIQSLWDPRLLVVLLFWTVILTAVYVLLTTETMEQSHKWLVSMSSALTVIPFIPSSNLLFRVGFVLAERVLYVPSMGYCLLVAILLFWLYEYLTVNHYLGAPFVTQQNLCTAVIVVLLANAGRSVMRNSEWLKEHALYESALSVCPNNAKVHYNLAKVLADQGAEYTAEMKYRHAISLNPHYEQAMNNLANMLEKKGHYEEAAGLLRIAISIRPSFATAWMNLGIVLAASNQSAQAEHAYLSALRLRPTYADCHYNLGNLYLAQGKPSLALNSWHNATQLAPKHRKSWINRLILLDELDDCSTVVQLAQLALNNHPQDHSIMATFGSCLAKMGRFREAETQLLQVLSLNERDANSWGNLGVMYHRWKQFSKAQSYYKTALKLDPGLRLVRTNLDMMLRARS